MTLIALGLGLVLVIEGLALALAPSRLDQVMVMLQALPAEKRRRAGLAMVAGGAALLMIWRWASGA